MTKFIFMGIGTMIMLVISLIRRKKYNFALWQSVVFPVLLAISGILGAFILYFIESGRWGGISFYGSILLIPILMIPISLLIRIPYGKCLDYSVPQICAMLASMKLSCFVSGCCGGILLFTTASGREVFFPSQIIELIISVGILFLILWLDNKGVFANTLYGVYYLVYGFLRLILNFFRRGISPFVWVMPAGHFWSIIAILIGACWISIRLYEKSENDSLTEVINKNIHIVAFDSAVIAIVTAAIILCGMIVW